MYIYKHAVHALTVKFPVYHRVLSTFAVLAVSLYVQPIILVWKFGLLVQVSIRGTINSPSVSAGNKQVRQNCQKI